MDINSFSALKWVASVIAILAMTTEASNQQMKQYAMYVWTTGYDAALPGCDVSSFLGWNTHGTCFSHVWNTEENRQWLWNTCSLTGREISTIFISDVHHNLKHAYDSRDCSSSDINMVKQMLTEGHAQVPNLKIYGLYAVSDLAVSEKDLVKYIVYYNDVCAASNKERFDGVAVNNEAYAPIKCGNMVTRLNYLDNLQQIVTEAAKQTTQKLMTHYSVSWHWGVCHGHKSMMTWHNKTDDVVHHMIDIFDSVDVQVGYITFPAISDRLKKAGYDYATSHGKKIYATVYTNKASPCQITFFPSPTCHQQGHGHTEAGMFATFDEFTANGIEHAQPCIHYFRGVYSSGGNADWPVHNSAPQAGPVVG